MFVVGMEVDVERLRRRARATLLISNAGIVVPFALGVVALDLPARTLRARRVSRS